MRVQVGKSRHQRLHVYGLEDFGFPSGEACPTEQVAIAGGVDEDTGEEGAAAGFVLDDRRVDAIPFADSGSEPRTEEKPDAVLTDERVEFKGKFRAVETELPAMHRRDLHERAPRPEPLDHFHRQSPDDLFFLAGITDRMPLVHLGGGRAAAEDGILFDESNGKPETRRPDGGKDPGAGAAHDAQIASPDDGGLAGRFRQGFVDGGRAHGHGITQRAPLAQNDFKEQSIPTKICTKQLIRGFPLVRDRWIPTMHN